MKKIFIVIFLLLIQAGTFAKPADKARGFFVAFGVGPRLPLASFSNRSDIGYGFDVEFSYTDNEYIPVFIFARLGYDQFPGSQSFYQTSDYSNYSVTNIPVNLGIRYYFPPLFENVVLMMPILEASVDYSYYQKLHQFKLDSGKINFTEESSKLGVSVGGGFSMFLLEILATYNFYQNNQFLSFDLKVRLPLFINY